VCSVEQVFEAITDVVSEGQKVFYSTKNRDAAALKKSAQTPSSLKVQGGNTGKGSILMQSSAGDKAKRMKTKAATGKKKSGSTWDKQMASVQSVDEEVDEQLHAAGFRAEDIETIESTRDVIFRMFVKTREVDAGRAAGATPAIVASARIFARLYAELDPDDIVGDEFMSLPIVMDTVKLSVEKECKVRSNKLASLRQRQVSVPSRPVVVRCTFLHIVQCQ
jgi:hypothetical protein